MNAEVLEALSSIKEFSDLDPQSLGIGRLGGLTNCNYKIDCEHGPYVLRLAGEGTGDYIDRKAEFHNATIASEVGVNAEIIHFDADNGTMVCRYIDNAVTMDIDGLRNPDALRRTGQSFRRWHDCGRDFQGRFELFQQVDQYLAVLRDMGTDLPDGYSEVQKDAEQVRAARQ